MSPKTAPRTKHHREDVTLKDIAEAVGKSVAAVSRALNNYNDISPETREYIKRVAREMGYAPSETLGFILPTVSPRASDPFFVELITSITCAATQQGFDLLVSTCPPGNDENWSYLRLINSRRVDGIIVSQPRPRDARIQLLLEKQFPFVVIGSTSLPGVDLSVSENEAQGAQLAVEHLVEQGHQKIALINTPASMFFSLNFLTGFRDALDRAGLTPNEEIIVNAEDCSQKAGYNIAQTLLSRAELPSAIVVADDVTALGVMAAIQDQGLEVGNDVVVTGYGDILLSEFAQPPLTTVHRSTDTLGQTACNMLIARLRGDTTEPQHVVLEPSLVIRQSSDLALWL
ncbi:MAG: LacI family DNA-binding transcriptional regulator [Anaerolineae bacterium]